MPTEMDAQTLTDVVFAHKSAHTVLHNLDSVCLSAQCNELNA